MPTRPSAVTPRKRPLQERSRATVDSVLAATIQVLVKEGYERLTTTRVAQAAGVSVGSLYQYFPAKESLVLTLLETHLEDIYRGMERGLAEAGPSLAAQVDGILGGLLAAKGKNPALTTALKNQTARLEGHAGVRRLLARTQALVAEVLAAHRKTLGHFDPAWSAFVVTSAVDGVISSVLETDPRRLADPQLRIELGLLIFGYLGKTP